MKLEGKVKKALDKVNTIPRTILFPVGGVLEVGSGSSLEIPIPGPGDYTIIEVYLNIEIVPTGAAVIVDMDYWNGTAWTTIFTDPAHRPQILAGAKTGSTILIDVALHIKNTLIRPNIDQIGSTVAGAGLVISVRCLESYAV